MSFLSKALTVVGAVVGIAAAVATGGALGFLAAGLIGLGAASSLGLVGGSIGKFMNSGIGRGLVLAAGAYAAIGAFNAANSGSSALAANQTEAGAAQVAQQGTSAAADTATQAANIPGLAGAPDVVGTNASSAALSDASTASASGTNLTSMQVNYTAEQEAAQQTGQVSNEVASASGHGMLGEGPEGGPSGTLPSSPGAAQSAVQSNASSANLPMNPDGSSAVSGPSAVQPTVAPSAAPDNSFGAAGAQPGAGSSGGMLDKAMKFADTKGGAALITAGGSMLSGIGQGIAQKQATEDAIRAQQWSANRWTTPGLTNGVLAASQGNINVPGGYLQRAAAVRNLTNNTNVPYGPTSGPVPMSALPGAAGAFGGVPGPVKG